MLAYKPPLRHRSNAVPHTTSPHTRRPSPCPPQDTQALDPPYPIAHHCAHACSEREADVRTDAETDPRTDGHANAGAHTETDAGEGLQAGGDGPEMYASSVRLMVLWMACVGGVCLESAIVGEPRAGSAVVVL